MSFSESPALDSKSALDWSLQVPSTTPGGTSDTSGLTSANSSVSLPSYSYTASKPKILLLGLSRSGKTSIRHVVFHKMSANETQFLESTPKIDKIDISNKCFLDFQLWDFPGRLDLTHWQNSESQSVIEGIFSEARVLIFVIDPMEDHACAIDRLHSVITIAYKNNPTLKFEVFIHKSDGLTDEQKVETIRELTHNIHTRLVDSNHRDIYLGFRTTSIYDHSIFEAMSIVCQQLLENILAPFENILNAFVSSNKMEKAFIFDVHPKIFLATDSSPFDMPTYELCCDMLDLIFDYGCIYHCNAGKSVMSSSSSSSSNERSCGTQSVIRLSDSILHLKQINKYLALVCIEQLQGDMDSSTPQGLLDYNFQQFKRGINKVLDVANF